MTLSVYERAARLIESGFCKGRFEQFTLSGTEYCALGALRAVRGAGKWIAADDAALKRFGLSLSIWNDRPHTTGKMVAAFLRSLDKEGK